MDIGAGKDKEIRTDKDEESKDTDTWTIYGHRGKKIRIRKSKDLYSGEGKYSLGP